MNADERRPLVAANWKMNLVRREAESYVATLRSNAEGAEVVLFPSAPLLVAVAAALRQAGLTAALGGQDGHWEDRGAFTGDVSMPQLADAGCSWVLCGHSERRRDHGESDATVGRKVAAAGRHGLTPLLCVGERREERQAGATFAVLERQLEAGLASQPGPVVVAYEPVWAIGTGETATPELAQAAHAFLRARLAALLGESTASSVWILYGGSVTPENAGELFREPDIDGFLVGGASLDAGKFLAIIEVCGSPRGSA